MISIREVLNLIWLNFPIYFFGVYIFALPVMYIECAYWRSNRRKGRQGREVWGHVTIGDFIATGYGIVSIPAIAEIIMFLDLSDKAALKKLLKSK